MDEKRMEGILKRISEPNPDIVDIKKTISKGEFTVHNVPFLYKEDFFPDGEQEAVPLCTVYQLGFIFEHMEKHNLKEVDFEDYPIEYEKE